MSHVPMTLLSLTGLRQHGGLHLKLMTCPEHLLANLKFTFNLETEKCKYAPFFILSYRSFYMVFHLIGPIGTYLTEANAWESWGNSDHLSGSLHSLLKRSKWTKNTAPGFLSRTHRWTRTTRSLKVLILLLGVYVYLLFIGKMPFKKLPHV